MKVAKLAIRFNEKQKNYLEEKFFLGQETAIKWKQLLYHKR